MHWQIKTIYSILYLSLAFGFLCTVNTVARAESPGPEKLGEILAGIESLKAGFDQRVYDREQRLIQEVSGEMHLQRPGKFRWETGDPYPQVILTDGELVWLYDLDLEQITIQTLEDKLANTPAILLSGDKAMIEAAFSVVGEVDAKDSSVARFVLMPKTEGYSFTEFSVEFKAGSLMGLELKDKLGQKTLIEFTELQKNQSLPPSLFILNPPEGVDIIRDL